MTLRLWQYRFSTNVERVALALGHKGLEAKPVVIDPGDRAAVRDLTGQDLVPVLEDWKRPPNLLADAVAAGRDPAEPELARWAAELRGSVARFERLLSDRDYLLSGSFGVADVAVFPFLRYGVQLHDEDDELFHRILVEHLGLGQQHTRLRAWIARCDERPRAGLNQA